jgi:uncharacterized protein (TIGR02145 family)
MKKSNNKLGLIAFSFLFLILVYSCKKDKVATLTTNETNTVTYNSAICGGIISDDGGADISERGVCWSTSESPTIADNKTSDGKDDGSFVSNLTDLSANTTYYVRAYATNSAGTSYGNTVSFKTLLLGATGTVADIYGNIYNTIKIGTQTWMMENLKVTHYNNGNAISLITNDAAWSSESHAGYCWYNNDEATYKNLYGALYNWSVIYSNMLAPVGWHVPSDEDWTTLENYLIANGYNFDGSTSGNKYAKAMASTSLWNSSAVVGAVGNTDYPSYRNKSYFTALPGGSRMFDGSFVAGFTEGNYAIWWSSMQGLYWHSGWCRIISSENNYLDRFEMDGCYGFSVRCVKD